MTDIVVVVAAYDAAGTIGEALASVAAQTIAPAEVVVADDCSTDATAAEARAWADRLPMTLVRTPANRGPSAARALAIRASTGARIALLDADDMWMPDHLATMLDLYRDERTVAMADLRFWVPGVGHGGAWSDVHRVPTRRQLEALYRGNYVNSATLFARSLYEEVGGFRMPLRVGEDWDLWIRMVRAGAVIVAAGHATVRYRMKAAGDGAFADRLAVLDAAARESVTARERRAVARGRRRVVAEQHLFSAYRLAGDHPWPARRHGLRALGGSRRVATRGLAMALSPRRVAARRQAARADPGARLSG